MRTPRRVGLFMVCASALVLTVGGQQSIALAEEAAQEDQAAVQQALEEAMRKYQEELRAQEAARATDPAWTPSHVEVGVIRVRDDARPAPLNNYCLDTAGNILACCGGMEFEYLTDDNGEWTVKTRDHACEIRVFSPEGELRETWPLEFTPQAIARDQSGTLFVAGDGRLARLSRDGSIELCVDAPWLAPPKPAADEAKPDAEGGEKPAEESADPAKVWDAVGRAVLGLPEGEPSGESDAARKQAERIEALQARMMARRQREFTSIAIDGDDVYVVGMSQTGYAVWRTDRDFKAGEKIVDRLRGCCGQMDLRARDGVLYIAENGRHHVARYDRTGQSLGDWGRMDRQAADGFGGCCEPKNVCFDAEGNVLTSESGRPESVKRFTADGKFLGVVAAPKFEGGCVRMTLAVSPDGTCLYVLNATQGSIHRFLDKRVLPSHEPADRIVLAEGPEPLATVHTFTGTADGNLLVGGTTGGPEARNVVRLLDPEGKPIGDWKLDFPPRALAVGRNGEVYAGGNGRLVKLDREGSVLATADAPNFAEWLAASQPPPAPPKPPAAVQPAEVEKKPAVKRPVTVKPAPQLQVKPKLEIRVKPKAELQIKPKAELPSKPKVTVQRAAPAVRRPSPDPAVKPTEGLQAAKPAKIAVLSEPVPPPPSPEEIEQAARARSYVSGIAVTERDVFVAARVNTGFAVYRLGLDLKDPVKVLDGLRGCCGQMDIQAHDGDLFVAENCRFRVARYDREGKPVSEFGDRASLGPEGWGSCCNPMNTRFGPEGEVYVSESSVGRITRFTPDGKFLGVVGVVPGQSGCKHVPIVVSPDGGKVYFLDVGQNQIAVLARRSEPVVQASADPPTAR